MEQSARPGDVLADRYRLVDLLTESGGGRFWRAEDRVLDRHVALHCIAADDPRAPGLMEAARLSATVLDPRILRVLDADERDGLSYVVNEWGSGTSLDIMVGSEGPLPARRAAWIVSEVADSMAEAHERRVAHGRLSPENVLIDQTGSVRVIGFCVDAALMGLPRGEISTDVADLGGLLYFLLTGKWAGESPSNVPPALRRDRRWLRPRQVRAGIPRVLDALCDHVLNPFDAPPAEWAHNLHTARGLCETLREYVGDPAGLAEPAPLSGIHGLGVLAVPERRPSAAPPPPESTGTADDTETTRVEPAESEPTLVVPPAPPPPVTPPESERPDPVEEATDPAGAGPVSEPPAPGDVPTQAGMPIFDDATDDVSWLERRREPPPPPPAFEEPPERPLFAPEPADGGPARRPRPGVVPQTGDYWPWETGTGAGTGSGVIPVTEDTGDDEVPGRSWLRLAALILVSLLLLVAVVIAYNLGRGKTPLGAEPEADSPSSSSPVGTAGPSPIRAVAAHDLDPQGDPPKDENPDLVGLAVDGDPSTAWRTSTYFDQFGPGGLKTGVGLYLDLGESREVSQIDLTVIGVPTSVSYYLTDEEPTSVAGLTPVAEEVLDRPQRTTALEEPATGRYLVVWITSLAPVGDDFRAQVAEVVASG